MKHKTALAAQVVAWNRVNAEANKLAVQLAEICKPLVGKKVTCQGGSLTQKAKALLPEWNGTPDLRVWHSCGSYELNFMVRATEEHDKGDYCGNHYAETWVTVGPLKDHVLESVPEPVTNRRTDYTEEEVQRLRDEVTRTETAFHDAEINLRPFKRFGH